jgi:hypothetical protein
MTNNNIINFLWIGDFLNKNCQLTLKSFLDYEHEVHLWAYAKDIKNAPSGTIIKDANEIIPKNKVFSYKGGGDCQKGSYGGFSDIFRYHLINNVGGWYCDMDVTCLKNFSTIKEQEYVFRPHSNSDIVANIFKAPKDSEFLKSCIKNTEAEIDENNTSWVKPLFILSDCVKRFKYEKYIVDRSLFGDDNSYFIRKIVEVPFKRDIDLPEYAIHWCNQAITSGIWDSTINRSWDSPLPFSLYSQLLKKHKLI